MTKDILLLHGALGAASQFDGLGTILQQKGYRVHTFSFNGHGSQSKTVGGFGIETFAHETHAFLESKSLSDINIFGYSMGGYVALWLALHHPEKVNRIVTLGTKFDWSVEAAEKEIKKLNPEKILEKVPAFAKVLEVRHQSNDWKNLMLETATMMKQLGNNPLLTPENLSHIDKSTLILLGDKDDMVDRAYSQQVAGFLPNAAFELLPETPHLLEQTNVEMLAEKVTTFFELPS